MDKVKIGVIGAGYWGPNLIRNFVEMRNSQVVVVSDLKDDRLNNIQTRNPGVQTTKDYCDIFKMGLDAVAIATPPATHFKFAKEALEHGLHTFVEKPITMNSEEAEELVDLAKRKGLILMVGHTFRYNSAVVTLKRLIEQDEIGKVYYLDSAWLNLGLFQKGSHVLWDLGPHNISIYTYLLNELPISVSARGVQCAFNGIYDVVYLNLVYPNNVLGHIHLSWLDPCKVRRVTVVGSKKMVVFSDIESAEKIKIYDKGVESQPYSSTFEEFQVSYRYGDLLIPNIRFSEPLRAECQDFADSIQKGGLPSCSGEDGVKVVKIMEAAERSLLNDCSEEKIRW
jgi:predicted dehydrogenase